MPVVRVKNKPFFNDRQLARVIAQVMSCFAGYQVDIGQDRNGIRQYKNVPIKYGDYDATAAYIAQGGNDNMMISLPIMSLDLTRMRRDERRMRSPQHTEKLWYTPLVDGTDPGPEQMIERAMPVPYDLGFALSIWASNKDQLFQIIEQIAAVFNPDMDIQLSNSSIDWTFLSSLIFDGEVAFGSTAKDSNTDGSTYTATMNFSNSNWISLPVIKYEAKLIKEVDVNLSGLNAPIDWNTMDSLTTLVITGDEELDVNGIP